MSFIAFNRYNEHQKLLSSGRIIVNAKTDNIFLLAKKDISMSVGNSIHINVGTKDNSSKDSILIVNSPKIQLGLSDDKNQLEPVAKGDQTVNMVNEVLNNLKSFMNTLQTAKGAVTGGTAELLTINVAAKDMVDKITKTQEKLKNIKSNVTFTI